MTAKVRKVIGRWMGADGDIAEVVLDGCRVELIERFAEVSKLSEPRHKVKTHIELEDGKRVELPFPERARILPNARAVVVLDESLEVEGGAGSAPQ